MWFGSSPPPDASVRRPEAAANWSAYPGRILESIETAANEPGAASGRGRNLLKLAWTFGWISALAFGGSGIVLMRRECCDTRKWITELEFLETYGIAQVSPGSIPVSLACLIGRKVAGTPGFFVCMFAVTVPGFVVLMTLAMLSMSPHMDILRHALKGAAAAATGMLLGNAMELTYPYRRKYVDLALICAAAAAVVVFHLQLVFTLLLFVPLSIGVLRMAKQL